MLAKTTPRFAPLSFCSLVEVDRPTITDAMEVLIKREHQPRRVPVEAVRKLWQIL